MSAQTDETVLAAVRRFRGRAGGDRTSDSAELTTGRLLRMLAASKPGGLLLCADAPESCFWLAAGMDIGSKLICLSGDQAGAALLKSSLADDIRISVHCQHLIAFLGDVGQHRFDLMVFSSLDAGLSEMVPARLAAGGAVAVCAPGNPDEASAAEDILSGQGRLYLCRGPGGSVVGARIPDDHLRKRRGGRRQRGGARA